MIAVMYAGNEKMFDGILISALSTVKHTKESINAYILTMDLSDKNPYYKPITVKQKLFIENIYRCVNDKSTVTVLDAEDLYRKALLNSPNAQTDYTPYSFLRLFADCFPDIPDKVLYLDTDTVINGNLSSLFHTDIAGYEYGAVLDYYGKWFMGYNYVNSGVMLLNMKEIEKTGLLRRAIKLCSEQRLFLPDQTALHRLTKKKYILPRKYNEQKYYDNPDTVIQHFTKTILWLPYFHTRNIKPWQTDEVEKTLTNRYNELLREYKIKKQEYEDLNYEKTR